MVEFFRTNEAAGLCAVPVVAHAAAGCTAGRRALAAAKQPAQHVAKTAATQWNTYTGVLLRSRLGLHVNLMILHKAASVSYPHFEDPIFINQLTQAR